MEQRRQFAEFARRNATNLCCPFRCFSHPIGFTRQVVGEFIETAGTTCQEFRIVPAVFNQRMGDTQHHRHVGAHMRGDPLGAVAEEIHGFRTHWVNTEDALAAFAQRVEI